MSEQDLIDLAGFALVLGPLACLGLVGAFIAEVVVPAVRARWPKRRRVNRYVRQVRP